MLTSLPNTPTDLLNWGWPEIEPHYRDLAERPLTAASVADWLADWSQLAVRLDELQKRLYVATTVNTADAEAQARHAAYFAQVYPGAQAAEQTLKRKLLDSGLQPEGFAMPLRTMRAEAAIFREANLPLLAQEQGLYIEHDRIVGAQTVEWEGREVTLPQLQVTIQGAEREVREQAWRLAHDRWLADRKAINSLWTKFLRLRLQVADNAGFGQDYRAYRWQQVWRFDYTPADCLRFQQAIEAVATPAAARIYERRRKRLGVQTLRPWDLGDGWWARPAYPPDVEPLRPFSEAAELEAQTAVMFQRVDPQFGAYFEAMRREGLLDLESRKHKAAGAYCEEFLSARQAFILMNAAGSHDDVSTLLHEGGHAMHVYEKAGLPYFHLQRVGNEFGEVASMSMELLAAPYLAAEAGGFYSEADAARARVEHLEENILFWPFMAVVDAFQHWVYEHPHEALEPDNCDAQWAALWGRFMGGVDWSGLEQVMMTGWNRKAHIHQDPFYYVDYGLAQLGAMQIWQAALKDQAAAVARYRAALGLGGSVPLPQLYQAAGARLAFDADTLRQAVALAEATIDALEG
jgi:oligoendopeptidase F